MKLWRPWRSERIRLSWLTTGWGGVALLNLQTRRQHFDWMGQPQLPPQSSLKTSAQRLNHTVQLRGRTAGELCLHRSRLDPQGVLVITTRFESSFDECDRFLFVSGTPLPFMCRYVWFLFDPLPELRAGFIKEWRTHTTENVHGRTNIYPLKTSGWSDH